MDPLWILYGPHMDPIWTLDGTHMDAILSFPELKQGPDLRNRRRTVENYDLVEWVDRR